MNGRNFRVVVNSWNILMIMFLVLSSFVTANAGQFAGQRGE